MKVGGQIPWNVTPVCETSQIYYLMGRRPMKDVLGNHFSGPIAPFGSLVEYHHTTANDQSRIHQFGKKVLPGLFLRYDCSSVDRMKVWLGEEWATYHGEGGLVRSDRPSIRRVAWLERRDGHTLPFV